VSRQASTVPTALPLRWGVLGTGAIARKFVEDIQSTGTGFVVACGSRATERSRSFATEFRLPRAYGSYGELIRDQEVEAVYVATPHSCHHQDTLAALKNGKHVLCEKPIAINSIQSKEMFNLAETQGVVLMEGLWTLHLPTVLLARRWISEGSIGEVRSVDAEFGFPAPALSPSHRLLDPALGGGALLDIGVYPVALAQLLGGLRAPRIKSMARMIETGVDGTTHMLLEWSRGIQANLRCSIEHEEQRPAVIHGTAGTITLPEFWGGRTAILNNRVGETVFRDGRTTHGYEFEVAAFTRAVRGGLSEDPTVSRAFSQRLATTLDGIRKQIGLVYPADDALNPQGSRQTR